MTSSTADHVDHVLESFIVGIHTERSDRDLELSRVDVPGTIRIKEFECLLNVVDLLGVERLWRGGGGGGEQPTR